MLEIGFEKEFESVREAWAFMVDNNSNCPDGYMLSIPIQNTRLVKLRLIAEPETQKTRRDEPKIHAHGIVSDDLGVNGIINHADGKRYDSKSAFRKATRRAGCYEVGNDVKSRDVEWKPPIERGVRGDYNVAPALKEALQKRGR